METLHDFTDSANSDAQENVTAITTPAALGSGADIHDRELRRREFEKHFKIRIWTFNEFLRFMENGGLSSED